MAKGFEPLLLVPIAFGMLLSNLPLSGVMSGPISVIEPLGLGTKGAIEASIHTGTPGGLLYYLFLGDEFGIFPPLIFSSVETLKIFALGVVAFGVGTAAGVICAKIMNKFTKEKINPLIGGAGVSAVPMAARVAHKIAQEENPGNFILMHAMGPNVAGVIGSAVAAGILLSLLG
ncbi:sodium ion-translocating decarboxylase subunit beta [Romboutsia sp.]|uniref:sodium ion-translocating decarboxylase subunit beta n=1 Tax=Romboutsia sp. TaxID=1965302 RepID=UPI003F3F2E11